MVEGEGAGGVGRPSTVEDFKAGGSLDMPPEIVGAAEQWLSLTWGPTDHTCSSSLTHPETGRCVHTLLQSWSGPLAPRPPRAPLGLCGQGPG